MSFKLFFTPVISWTELISLLGATRIAPSLELRLINLSLSKLNLIGLSGLDRLYNLYIHKRKIYFSYTLFYILLLFPIIFYQKGKSKVCFICLMLFLELLLVFTKQGLQESKLFTSPWHHFLNRGDHAMPGLQWSNKNVFF